MEIPEKNRKWWLRWGPVCFYLLLGASSLAVSLPCQGIFKEDSAETLIFCFLYPLLGGGLAHLLLAVLVAEAEDSEYYLIFLALYNAGILLLTANQAVAGLLEITGSDLSYISLTAITGWTLTAAGGIVLTMVVWDVHESGRYQKHRHNHNRDDRVKEEHHE